MSERNFQDLYRGYNVLAKRQSPSWNDLTRQVVEERLRQIPPRRFFSSEEWSVLEALCCTLVPQPDRPNDPIPIAPWIDDKLNRGERDGYRHQDMPSDDVAWRKGLRGIEDESVALFGRGFARLVPDEQDEVLHKIRRGEVSASSWGGISPSRFFNIALKEVVGVYYAHPTAWSEIGFGGPAGPRGYVRLGVNEADPWEARERRQQAVASD